MFYFVFFPPGARLRAAAPGLEFLLRAVLTGSTNPARPRPPRASPPCPWVTSPRGRAGRSSSRPACSPSVSPRLTRSWHRCPDRHGATVTPKRAAGVSGPCLCNADHLLLWVWLTLFCSACLCYWENKTMISPEGRKTLRLSLWDHRVELVPRSLCCCPGILRKSQNKFRQVSDQRGKGFSWHWRCCLLWEFMF